MSSRLESLIREAANRLPSPSRAATTRARRAALDALAPRRREPQSRLRLARRAAVSAAVAAVALIALGVGVGLAVAPGEAPRRSGPADYAGPGFLPAHGWTTVAEAWTNVAWATAANVPFRDRMSPGAVPEKTLRTLPADGIVLVASFSPRRAAGRGQFPRRSLPLSLRDATVAAELGLPRYRIRAATGGYDVDVRVFFGSPPSRRLLAEAQEALSRLGVSPITITARPTVLASRISPQYEPLRLSGTIASREAGETITIQANECSFPGWRDVATTRTEAGGRWELSADQSSGLAQTRTTFRAKWRTATSARVTVQTRPGVNLGQTTRTRWGVGVLALRSFLDRIGLFQRYDRGRQRWTTVKRFRLTTKDSVPAGSWTYGRFRARVARGSLVRAVIPRSQVKPCYLAGYSLLLEAR